MEIDNQPTSIELSVNNEFQNVEIKKEFEIILSSNLKAPFFEDDDRAPIDLVAVVDVSGSMRGHMKLVQDTLSFMVNQLASRDKFCMITFENNVATPLKWTLMNSDGKQRAQLAIKGLVAGGGTFLSGGLLSGVRAARTRLIEESNDVCSVLLFTDGAATSGIKDSELMKEAIADLNCDIGYTQQQKIPSRNKQNKARVKKVNKRSQKMPELKQAPQISVVPQVDQEGTSVQPRDCPFTIYTFGYGPSHQSDLLRSIASDKDGVYYYIEHQDSIADSFTDCLGGLLSVVGQNIDLTVSALDGVNIEELLVSSYRTTTVTDKKEYIIHLGDIQSEEEKDILIKAKVKALKTLGDNQLVNWNLSYFNVLTCDQEENRVSNSVTVLESVEDPIINPHIIRQKFRVGVSKALNKADELRRSGDKSNAITILEEELSKLLESGMGEDKYILDLIADVREVLEDLKSNPQQSSKQLHNKMAMHSRQRNACGESSKSRYTTNKKAAMQMRYNS